MDLEEQKTRRVEQFARRVESRKRVKEESNEGRTRSDERVVRRSNMKVRIGVVPEGCTRERSMPRRSLKKRGHRRDVSSIIRYQEKIPKEVAV